MSKLLVANWKMNPMTATEAVQLAKACDEKNVVLCPPFPFLSEVKNAIRKADLGAQDVFWKNPIPGGAFTGEVSIGMLKKIGVSHVIIGHSERRDYLGETDEMINEKIKSALAFGLKVVLCVGEPLSVRREGLESSKIFVKSQLTKNLKNTSNIKPITSNLIVTYEPIWAISAGLGTGKPNNPEDSASMIAFIKEFLISHFMIHDPRVLYGASVTSKDAERIFEHKEIDGALVGGASLKAEEFKKIIKITSRTK